MCGSHLIIFIEGNYGWTLANRFLQNITDPLFCRKYGPIHVVKEDFAGRTSNGLQAARYGVFMSKEDKERYHFLTNEFLIHDRISILKECVTNDDNMINMLREQFCNFKWEKRVSHHPEFNDSRLVPSGKKGGNVDDLIIALMMALFWRKLFMAVYKII